MCRENKSFDPNSVLVSYKMAVVLPSTVVYTRNFPHVPALVLLVRDSSPQLEYIVDFPSLFKVDALNSTVAFLLRSTTAAERLAQVGETLKGKLAEDGELKVCKKEIRAF